MLLLVFSAIHTQGQDLTGLWHGYITASAGEVDLPSSGYSLNIKQQQGDIISGSAYIYGKHHLKFEGHLDFIGTTNQSSQNVTITELRIMKYIKPSDQYMLCIKLEDLKLVQENSEQYLLGSWEGAVSDGKLCVPGSVVLKKHNPASPDENGISDTLMRLISQDTITRSEFLKTTLAEPIIIPVSNPWVQLELRDYMREDNDTISVFHNRREVIQNLRITKKPKKFSLLLNPKSELNEIILYARNLGYIPPNTANLTIDDGTRKHRVLIESTLQKSAVIYLRYTGKRQPQRLTSVKRE